MASSKYQQVSNSVPIMEDSRRLHGQQGPVDVSKSTSGVYVNTEYISGRESPPSPQQYRSKERKFSYVKDWWLLEILGALMSVTFFSAIIVVLAIYKERRLDSWTLPIRINSLISLFAVFAKACILLPIAACISQLKWRHFSKGRNRLADFQLFDMASRGPLGAFDMLLHVNKVSALASFASFVTLAALAIDPFTQMVLSFPSRSVVGPDEALIRQTQVYDTGLSQSNRQASSVFADVQMQGSIYRGLFLLPNETMFTCSTGSCDWNDFSTFGVCNETTIVTEQTQRSCFNYTSSGTGVRFDPADSNKSDWPMACNYTTPSGLNLWTWSGMNGVGPWYTAINSTAAIGRSADNSTIVSISTVRLSQFTSGFALPMGEVTESRLFWCAKTYRDVKVRGGVIITGQEIVNKLVTNASLTWGAKDKDVHYTVLRIKDEDRPNWTFNDTFTINSNDISTTAYFLKNVFTTVRYTATFYSNEPGVLSVSSAMARAADMASLVSSVAHSMTDRMRSVGNSTLYTGNTLAEVSYIHVRWAWLAFPALLILSGCGLLAALIVLSSRSATPIWQSNSLALMFHGLHDGGQYRLSMANGVGGGTTMTNTEINDAARSIEVKLESVGPGRDDLKLVKSN